VRAGDTEAKTFEFQDSIPRASVMLALTLRASSFPITLAFSCEEQIQLLWPPSEQYLGVSLLATSGIHQESFPYVDAMLISWSGVGPWLGTAHASQVVSCAA
jgi:hypothetical protein